MLYVGIVKENEYSQTVNVFEANSDETIGEKIAEAVLYYDMGDTLAEVEVVSGYLDEEQFDALCDGEDVSYFEEEVA